MLIRLTKAFLKMQLIFLFSVALIMLIIVCS